MGDILWFDQIGLTDLPRVGGKNAVRENFARAC